VKSQSDEGTVVSEQSEQEQAGSSFQDSLLKDAADMGHSVGPPKDEETESDETPEAETETEVEAEGEQVEGEKEEESEGEEQTEEQEQKEELKPAAEHKSIDEQIKEFTEKGEKPPWYLTRISAETRKRQERTEVSKKLFVENQQLKQQLATAAAPRPTSSDPLIDVYTDAQFAQVESMYEQISDLPDLYPDGINEEVTLPDGSKVSDVSHETLVKWKRQAEKMLRTGIPDRKKFVQARYQQDNEARKIYPELNDEDSGWVQMGQQLIAAVPELTRVPDCWLWLGRALRGYQLEQAQAAQKKNGAAKKIVEARSQKKAPVLPKSRGFIQRSGADLDAAKKRFAEKGDQESAEAYLEARGVGGGPKSRPALVR